MPIHIIGKNNPECPLCKKPFERAVLANKVEYYFCRKDKIQIFVNDPMVEQWTNIDPETGEAIACANPKCRDKMNIFCRSDGYIKAVCPNPRCGAEIESHKAKDGHMDVEKGKGADNIDIIKSNARKNWKNN